MYDIPDGQYNLQGVSFEYINKYDSDGNTITFRLDDKIYIFHENPSDGYRSYCEDPEIKEPEWGELLQFIIPVEVKNIDEITYMYSLATGKEILRVGTENSDDYYPWCVMEWNPSDA